MMGDRLRTALRRATDRLTRTSLVGWVDARLRRAIGRGIVMGSRPPDATLIAGGGVATDGFQPVRLDVLPGEVAPYVDVLYMPPPLFSGRWSSPATWPQALLVGRHPLALTDMGHAIPEAIFRTAERQQAALDAVATTDLLRLRGLPRSRMRSIPGQVCVLASRWDSFGHWIPEHLLKIHSLLLAGIDLADIQFVVRAPVADFKLRLLAAAGIGTDRILPWRGGVARIERLLVPDYPQPTREGLEWIAGLMPSARSSAIARSRRIHVSRQRQRTRAIANIEDVTRALSPSGFESVHPEDLPFDEQVAIARGADVLFGPQGSAFTLQIFMPSGGTVIQAFGRSRVHLFDRQIAMVLGHRHRFLLDPRGPLGGDAVDDDDLIVDISALESELGTLADRR